METHAFSVTSYSSFPCPAGRCWRSHEYHKTMRGFPSWATAKRIESYWRSFGRLGQAAAYPMLQKLSRTFTGRSAVSRPGAQHRPFHPAPKGKREGCIQVPCCNLSVGIKKGQAMRFLARMMAFYSPAAATSSIG